MKAFCMLSRMIRILEILVSRASLSNLKSRRIWKFAGIKFYRILAEDLKQCLLNEVKYQSHVRIRIRFRSDSGPVRGGDRDRVRI